ncbi:hypothetical protein [Candidatus Protochlamydia phocaeensis]|uniref:hypothetical protein n=1 Tax=Candidatus Protochlamydia phocaeensis TaxID=1414722 RepID=UPI000AE512DA|nr:hypothetical protein [Candidatus Protochlamydia phocaeensis]
MHRPSLYLLLFMVCLFGGNPFLTGNETLVLRDNLQRAEPGDYLVISSNKTDTLMHIYAKQDNVITIEEIAVPDGEKPNKLSWKDWVTQNAPGNTSWVMYDIDLRTGQMISYYSFTKRGWYEIPDADNFLSKLLNLRLTKIPLKARKKVGPKPTSGPDFRPLWQPRMIVDGKTLKDVQFDGWTTKWPRDSSDLSGKTIEVYLPQESQRYPSYFPYWLQINGAVGKAKIRVIDSGNHLHSPKPPLSELSSYSFTPSD